MGIANVLVCFLLISVAKGQDISEETLEQAELLLIKEANQYDLTSNGALSVIHVPDSALTKRSVNSGDIVVGSPKSRMLNTDHACGFCKTDIKLGDAGNITSAGFPEPYPDDQQCLWLLQTTDGSRIKLTCDTIQLQSCGTLNKDSPGWNDYLVISPLWTFKKSWVYCGHATTMTSLRHTSICDKMAVTFRSDNNGGKFKGFHCQYQAIENN